MRLSEKSLQILRLEGFFTEGMDCYAGVLIYSIFKLRFILIVTHRDDALQRNFKYKERYYC